MEQKFREKLAAAMVGHSLIELTVDLIDALAAVLERADPLVRDMLIEKTCAEIDMKAKPQ
jgi:hypothetical protein